MRVLAAGPWVGEFGYELFRWQSFVRAIAKDFDRVIVAGRPGNEVLYEDFSTRYIPYSSPMGACEGRLAPVGTPVRKIAEDVFRDVKFDKYIDPMNAFQKGPEEFVRYGKTDPDKAYDILIHARDIKAPPTHMVKNHSELKERRNWRHSNWMELLSLVSRPGLRVASIGAPEAAMHIPGTEDIRGIPLSQLVNVLRSSRLITGPSSGPMHLAALCKCHQVVWGKPQLVPRYMKLWNPFNTRVTFIDTPDSDWNVDVSRVADKLLSVM